MSNFVYLLHLETKFLAFQWYSYPSVTDYGLGESRCSACHFDTQIKLRQTSCMLNTEFDVLLHYRQWNVVRPFITVQQRFTAYHELCVITIYLKTLWVAQAKISRVIEWLVNSNLNRGIVISQIVELLLGKPWQFSVPIKSFNLNTGLSDYVAGVFNYKK
jgi:hypothetical protein